MGFFLLCMGMGFGLLASLPPVPQRFLATLFAIVYLVVTARELRQQRGPGEKHILQAYIFAFFLAYWLLRQHSSLAYYGLAQAASAVSAFSGGLVGRHLHMGLTYSGLDMLALFIIALLAAFFVYKRISVARCALYLVAMMLMWLLYLGTWPYLAENSLALRLNLLEPLTGPLDYRALLFCLLLPIYLRFYRRISAPKTSPQLNKAFKLAPVVLMGICAVTIAATALPGRLPTDDSPKRIVFWDTGIDFSLPSHEKYGLDYVGMFGLLPHYLQKQGYTCHIVEDITAAQLGEADVLVAFNPMHTPSEAELAALWRFVEAGGALLAVGDHTGQEQVRNPLNAMLQPAGIALNFDSAMPFKSLWAEWFTLRNSPLFAGVDSRQVQMVVGASLDIGPNARPLVIGREGYSDLGDMANTADGYLGDMRFNRGERIGDLILAAEATYGSGKMLAFGDTTAFQNTVLPYSYPFIDNIFAYLSSGQPQKTAAQADDFLRATCIVDASHLPTPSRDKSANAADGLLAAALRAGYMPYVNQSASLTDMLQERENVRLLVLLEPAIPFSAGELAELEAFMQAGGSIILCAGYASPRASQALAGHFGFSFEPLPIGRIAPDKNPNMAFWQACPVLYAGAFPDNNGDKVSSLMEIWGYSTVAHKAMGSGGLYVIGDPEFLRNKNLESVDTYRLGNILFVDSLLTDILGTQTDGKAVAP